MFHAKLLLAAALAISADIANGFVLSSGNSLIRAHGAAAQCNGRRGMQLAMTSGSEPSISRREVAAGMLLALSFPSMSWAEEEKKPSRFAKIREELLKEAEEEEHHHKGKKEEGALRMSDLREKMFKANEEAEEEMAKEAGEMKHISMKDLREQQEEYLRTFEHESEGVALAVEVANNEHFADKVVEPFFIFSPFFFLWSGFKLFNRKWNLGQ